MKNKKTILLILLMAVVSLASYGIYVVSHYYMYDDYKEWIQSASVVEEGSDFQTVKESQTEIPGMELVTENDFYKLYTNLESTQVAVYEKENGMVVYSNPQNVSEESLASGSNLSELNSQLVVEYFDINRNRIKINNYEMSTLAGQYEVNRIENGIRYTYTLADMTSATGIVPTVIDEEVLENKVLSKLDEKEAKDVRTKFANSKDIEGELILTENAIKSPIRMQRLNELFTKAGFNEEDFLAVMGEEESSEPLSLTIAIDYVLNDMGLQVTIPQELIKESEGASIANIEVLKFFGAQGMDAEGYMLVPNGSGSIIEMNNGKKNEAYSQYIYDMDVPAKSYVVTEDRETARLPVFGIGYEEGAIFAVIEAGDAVSQINADVAGKLNSYNYVYPAYALRGYELLSMFGSTGDSADLPVIEKEMANIDFSIQYNLLPGKKVTYSEMAKFYQNYLLEKGILTRQEESEKVPFYLDIIGGVQSQKNFLGVPYQSMEIMTSFEEAKSIVTSLQDEGISNIRLNYLGWFNGGYYHDVPEKIKDINKLGSKKALENLKNQIEATGGKLFGDVAFQQVPQVSKNYNLNMESTKYYSGMAVVRGKVNPSTVRETSSLGYDEAIYSIISPKFLNRYVSSFAEEIEEIDLSGISLRDLGDILSSDRKRTESIHREAAKDIVLHSFDQLEETNKDLMVSGGNAYSLAYAEEIIDLPMRGTDFYLVDYHVPFYQMVLHGYLSYAGGSINLSGDIDEQSILLDLIETGSAPRYTFSYADSVEMKYTSLNHMYSTEYKTWLSQASRIYEAINAYSEMTSGSRMIAHEVLENGLRKVTYENNAIFYLNRSNKEQTVAGHSIPAMGIVYVQEESE